MKKTLILLLHIVNCLFCIELCAEEKYTGKFVNMTATDAAEVYALSENGQWACGAHFANGDMNQAFYVYGSIWNTQTGERIYLEEDPTIPCATYWVNNEGTFAAGAHYDQPAYYINGLWHSLEMPRGYDNAVGEVSAVGFNDNGDTIMIGWAYTAATRGTIMRWINGELDKEFKYRNTVREWETKAEMERTRGLSKDAKVYLISLDHCLLPVNGGGNLPTTYVMTEDTTIIIERSIKGYDRVSFVSGAELSRNGKWVVGSIYGVGLTPEDGEGAISFLYEIETDRLQILEGREQGMMACTVDDYGRVLYCRGGGGTPLRKPFVKRENEFIPLEEILVKYDGITAEQIDAIMTDEVEEAGEDDLGTLYDVSADGRTILGCGGPAKKYNWVAHLSHSVHDMDPNVNDTPISYNNLAAFYSADNIILSGMVDKIEIYDLKGSLVMQENISSAFLPTNLKNGIYVIKLYNYKTNTITTSKIVIK
ncbi:MAG: hypothetical protein IJY67_05270 [Paludibacteraceae bacterium]|nr:hypothetical protein [Paludibacteraceae bacterium]